MKFSKLKISLRSLLIIATIACLSIPWAVPIVLHDYWERKLWDNYYSAKQARDHTIEEWRQLKYESSHVVLQRAYENAQRKFESSTDEILEFYSLELDLNGTPTGDCSDLLEGKKKYVMAVMNESR